MGQIMDEIICWWLINLNWILHLMRKLKNMYILVEMKRVAINKRGLEKFSGIMESELDIDSRIAPNADVIRMTQNAKLITAEAF